MKTWYAGTYTGNGSEGIYRFTLENKEAGEPELLCKIKNPKYITFHHDMIAAVCDFEHGAGAALISKDGEILDTIAYEQRTSCYIGSDGEYLYSTNFHEGTFTVLKVEDNHLSLKETVHIQDGGGCHQVLVYKDRLLVPCLFLDRIMMYERETLKPLGSIRFNTGTGPRHGVFSHDEKYLYLVSELSNELLVISTDTWEILSQQPVLTSGELHVRGGAAIRLSEDGKYLYASTRGKDVLSVFRVDGENVKLTDNVSCGGKHPRDFNIDENYLLCANRFSNEISVFPLNEGEIEQELLRIPVTEAVSLIGE